MQESRAELAAREAAALEAAGAVGAVMARLMTSESLAQQDKAFVAQKLNWMLSRLVVVPEGPALD